MKLTQWTGSMRGYHKCDLSVKDEEKVSKDVSSSKSLKSGFNLSTDASDEFSAKEMGSKLALTNPYLYYSNLSRGSKLENCKVTSISAFKYTSRLSGYENNYSISGTIECTYLQFRQKNQNEIKGLLCTKATLCAQNIKNTDHIDDYKKLQKLFCSNDEAESKTISVDDSGRDMINSPEMHTDIQEKLEATSAVSK